MMEGLQDLVVRFRQDVPLDHESFETKRFVEWARAVYGDVEAEDDFMKFAEYITRACEDDPQLLIDLVKDWMKVYRWRSQHSVGDLPKYIAAVILCLCRDDDTRSDIEGLSDEAKVARLALVFYQKYVEE